MAINEPAKEKVSNTKPATRVDWRNAFHESFSAIIITLACCLTAIICTWLAFGRGGSGAGISGRFAQGPRFQTVEFEDEDGKALLKFDSESGRTWRMSKMRVPVGARKADGSVGPELVAGWVEIAPTFEEGVQETWEKMGTPSPVP